jgi:hypothetical protein
MNQVDDICFAGFVYDEPREPGVVGPYTMKQKLFILFLKLAIILVVTRMVRRN